MLLQNKLFIAAIACLAISVAATGETLPEQFQLIPQPQQITIQQGIGLQYAALKTVRLAEDPYRNQRKGMYLLLRTARQPSAPEAKRDYFMVARRWSNCWKTHATPIR